MLFSSDHFGYFSLSDPAGIVFFQKVFELAHQCLEDYTRNSPITWHNWFAHAEWGVPLVHSESHFLSPLVSGQMITIELYLEKLGETSVTFKYKFWQNAKECCQLSTTHVFLHRTNHKKIAIPKLIKECLMHETQ